MATPSDSHGLRAAWRHRGALAWALWPVSLLYGALVGLRQALYAGGLLRQASAGIPVIVVGNVIAGGAGKTPVTLAVVRHLQQRGIAAGIVSRGYGRSTQDCRQALPDSRAQDVGDEPALLARASGVPVFVARERIAAVRALRAQYPATQVIVCDDGLQHLALARDVEICVFNDEGTGNGFLLPAGPLREPWPRAVDLVLHAGPRPAGPAPAFALQRRLATHAHNARGERLDLSALRGLPLHALAAVARPEHFFAMLQAQGLTLATAEALPDHYNFESWQGMSPEAKALICTEKDAVKLWPLHPEAWAVPLELSIEQGFFPALEQALSLSSKH
ncbi:tetraacyldisaccharide 4'-kinase [Acidovorax sp. Be4]|uniref:Tetraacyldisaccharide 4'-kinase n=1 Tax=Acidovorax bellezanensis TaxID=2976702 RepID=A0ABT2PS52_9BURK|nr:tetraacyldisaccharide 4'-kinase [Acidovorax sp. Be4]MCT9813048.1 tetraacyldisaccharide 4'-kinase [Acidovorax sp. Be4]